METSAIDLPDGALLTLDRSMTVGYVMSRGVRHIHYSQIAKRDPILPRDAHSPDRPVTACGRAAFFGHNS